jgi:hypothetical protein
MGSSLSYSPPPALLFAEQLPPEVSFALNVDNPTAHPELKLAWGLMDAAFGWHTEYQRERDFSESVEKFTEIAETKKGKLAYQAESVLGSLALFRARLERVPYTRQVFRTVYQERANTLHKLSTEIALLEEMYANDNLMIGQQYEELLLTLDAREGRHASFPASVREESAHTYSLYNHDSYRVLPSCMFSGHTGHKLPVQSRGMRQRRAAPEVCRVLVRSLLAKAAMGLFGTEAYNMELYKCGTTNKIRMSPADRTRLLLMTSQALQQEANGQEIDEGTKTYLDTVQDRYENRLRQFSAAAGLQYDEEY